MHKILCERGVCINLILGNDATPSGVARGLTHFVPSVGVDIWKKRMTALLYFGPFTIFLSHGFGVPS